MLHYFQVGIILYNFACVKFQIFFAIMGKYLDDRSNQYTEDTFMLLSLEERSNKDFVIKCLARNGRLYKVLSDELKQDMDVKMVAVKNDERVVYLFGKDAIMNIDFSMECLRHNDQVFPLLPVEVRGQSMIFQWALMELGVDAFWGMPLEYFRNIPYMVKALESQNGKNQDLWDAILSGAGDEAYFSKIVIEAAFLLHGNAMLDMEFSSLLTDSVLKNQVSCNLPDESWMKFYK